MFVVFLNFVWYQKEICCFAFYYWMYIFECCRCRSLHRFVWFRSKLLCTRVQLNFLYSQNKKTKTYKCNKAMSSYYIYWYWLSKVATASNISKINYFSCPLFQYKTKHKTQNTSTVVTILCDKYHHLKDWVLNVSPYKLLEICSSNKGWITFGNV